MRRIHKNKWFTLIEMIISIAILSILIPVIYKYTQIVQNQSHLERLKANTNYDISIVSSHLSNIIKNSYGIDYVNSSVSWNLDTLVLYKDKQEKQKIILRIERDLDFDISRISIKNWDKQEVPLHTSSLFIERFNITIPPAPNNTQTLNIQPMVFFDITARSRSPLQQPTDDMYYTLYNKTNTAIKGGVLVRNYVPSSLKQ